jgi:hypothetical protein
MAAVVKGRSLSGPEAVLAAQKHQNRRLGKAFTFSGRAFLSLFILHVLMFNFLLNGKY